MRALIMAITGAGLLVTGCKGTLMSGGSNAAVTGIWTGTDSTTNLDVTAYIDSSGRATFIRADGVQFAGTLAVSGNTISATVEGYTDFSASFSDGSTYGAGTVSGTVATGTLSATLDFTTQGGTAITGTWSLSFNALSNRGSSLATVSGNYTDTGTGIVIAIASNGVMSGQNSTNGCVLNGTISVINTSYDIYQVAYNYQSCTGTYAAVNGVQFTGLAALDPTLSPGQLTMAVAGASTAGKYGIISILTGG